MHTSNLWHVPTTTAAPTFQQREKSQSQTKTPLANLTKTFLSLYFSCAFLGSFIWYHPQVKPSPEGVQLYASPWHYPIFPILWHSRSLHCSQNWARGTPRYHQVLLRGTTDPRCCHQHWGGGICSSLSHSQHPLKLSTTEAHCRNAGEPQGVQDTSLIWLPPDKPCMKRQPCRCVPSFTKPACAILHHTL